MQVRALGPKVAGGREDLQLRDRAVIGVLVVRAGTLVAIDELGDAIWASGHQPRTARSSKAASCGYDASWARTR
jgi:hypothetical protein